MICRGYSNMILLFTATFTILALSSLDQVDCSAYDKIVTHSRIRAKKEGPNVCALQQVIGTKKKYFSTCRNWYKKSICGKPTKVLYECCPGYMKLDRLPGCPAVAPIDTVYGTLDLVEAKITKEYSEKSKLKEEIDGAGTYTMFAPSDDAWEMLDPALKEAMVNRGANELRNALTQHMVNKRLLTKDLKNDMSVESMFNEQGLYINHYSNGVVTVNCARIIHGNQVATNGVVHVIDRVISVVDKSILDVINTHDELYTLKASAETGLLEHLSKPGHYTLFAPTNDAFEKVDFEVLDRIMGDNTVLQAFLNYHTLKSVQCSEAIMGGSIYETLEGSNIEIGCDGDSLTVNGIKMVLKKDIVTNNGVIHLIDQVLMPDSAKQVMELIGTSQSVFKEMVSELGLSAAMKPKTEYTILAPLNGAFSDEMKTMDQRLLKIILENHILKFKISLNELYNGQLLETLGGKMLRVFIYRTAVCIENACMVRGSREGSNGALHLMGSLIHPPQTNIYELLKKEGRFKIFLSLMESAGITDLLKQEGSYTVFAPSDDAFRGLSEADINLLKSDINTLRTILLYHFSNGVFINGGLEGKVTNLLKTFQGTNLQVLSVNNSIHVNSVDVPNSDLMASNGVVHVVKTILYPKDLPVGREDILTLLKRLIKYMQLKFQSGYIYHEIPLTFIKRTITTTRVIEGGSDITLIENNPSISKVTTVIEEKPFGSEVLTGGNTTKVTRVIGSGSVSKKIVIEGDPSVTTVRRVIENPGVRTVAERRGDINRRVVQDNPAFLMERRGDISSRRVVEDNPAFLTERRGDRTVVQGRPSIVRERDRGTTKVTRVIEGKPNITKVTRKVGGPPVTKVTRKVEEEPAVTKLTRVIEGKPSITKVTRRIEGHSASSDGGLDSDGKIKRIVDVSETFLDGDLHVLREEDIRKITDAITEGGGPGLTTFTGVINPQTQTVEGKQGRTTFTRIINPGSQDIEGGQGQITLTRRITPDPQIIEGPDFSKIEVSFKDSPHLLEAKSKIISEIIKDGRTRKRAAVRQPLTGQRRRMGMVRRRLRPSQ
ncbi:periostin isoform X2 [Paramisgurnus dabryanus]|uniref:periostin isoform X2 n=1 Tax=Paramisgurnus dabryanus TaxID=90735 RepID=UPI0031F46752